MVVDNGEGRMSISGFDIDLFSSFSTEPFPSLCRSLFLTVAKC